MTGETEKGVPIFNRYKINHRVDFPLRGLDLTPYAIDGLVEGPVYDLFAIICHHGQTLNGGHYTACCKKDDDDGGAWQEYSDEHFSFINPEDVASKQAYVLFYRRNHLPHGPRAMIPQQSPTTGTDEDKLCGSDAGSDESDWFES